MKANTELQEKVRSLRAAGLSLRQVAEQCGISKVRVHQLENPYNPHGKRKRHACKRCGKVFTSTSRTKPARCPKRTGGCGSFYWDRDEVGTTRTPGPKPTGEKKRRGPGDPA